MTIEALASLIGAITGPAGLTIALLVYFRDRSKVRVILGWDRIMVGGPVEDKKTYTQITIINSGRRPIYLSHASIELPKRVSNKYGTLLFSDGIDGVTLGEGARPHVVTADQNHENIKNHLQEWWKLRAAVVDASGQKYYSDWPMLAPKEYESFTPSFFELRKYKFLNFLRKLKL